MQDITTVKGKISHSAHRQPHAFFRAYDVRGIYPDELDAAVAYKTAKAFLKISPGKRYVLAHDMRRSSKSIAAAITQAVLEENLELDSLGETTTDNLYFAVGKGDYDGGVMITASHNSAQFNGIKYVKKGAKPVLMPELKEAYIAIEDNLHYLPLSDVEPTREISTVTDFINHVIGFSDGVEFEGLKVVVDAGNGMAGHVTSELFKVHNKLQLVPMYFEPHPDFPHHEANPAILQNLKDLQDRVVAEKANLGVAFDGDGDRVFFVDENGEPVPGYYIQALLSEYFLNYNKGAAVIYDLRYTRAIESIARVTGGRAIVSKAGHSFIKQKMRQEDAIFGGESTSSHFYYRDNYYADSGLITLEIVLKLLSQSKTKMSELINTYKQRFYISGEKNFHAKKAEDFGRLVDRLKNEFPNGTFSEFDGFVIDFPDWRFSLRASATEPFWRLNIEANNGSILEEKQAGLFNILEEFAQFTGQVSNIYGLETLNLTKKQKLEYLFSNLHYTWNPFKGSYLDALYGTEWVRTQTPLDVLRSIDAPVLDKYYEENKYNVEESIRLQQTYLENGTWFSDLARNDKLISKLINEPVAYFSLEFGLVDWLQIYSGGLGALAGDTVKEATVVYPWWQSDYSIHRDISIKGSQKMAGK
jgi:phosphomannomutase